MYNRKKLSEKNFVCGVSYENFPHLAFFFGSGSWSQNSTSWKKTTMKKNLHPLFILHSEKKHKYCGKFK